MNVARHTREPDRVALSDYPDAIRAGWTEGDLARTVFNTPGLVVTGASAEHMLAMKIDAGRNSDEDDIGVLVDQLGITSADQALEIYRTVLAHTAAVDMRRRELVSKIVSERVRNRR